MLQCNGNGLVYGAICERGALKENLAMNCIPEAIFEVDHNKYEEFLKKRRVLMAGKMRDYYFSL